MNALNSITQPLTQFANALRFGNTQVPNTSSSDDSSSTTPSNASSSTTNASETTVLPSENRNDTIIGAFESDISSSGRAPVSEPAPRPSAPDYMFLQLQQMQEQIVMLQRQLAEERQRQPVQQPLYPDVQPDAPARKKKLRRNPLYQASSSSSPEFTSEESGGDTSPKRNRSVSFEDNNNKKQKKETKSRLKPLYSNSSDDSGDERLREVLKDLKKVEKKRRVQAKREKYMRQAVAFVEKNKCVWRGGSNQACTRDRSGDPTYPDLCTKHIKDKLKEEHVAFAHYEEAREILEKAEQKKMEKERARYYVESEAEEADSSNSSELEGEY